MAPKMKERLLRFPQSRNKSEYVLIQAVSTGVKPLDVKLIGTDGFAPFVVTLRQDQAVGLKHACPDDEWEDILAGVLSQEPPEGVQVTGKIESDADDQPTHLTLEVRRSVQGITKHLGDIRLRHREKQHIELSEWCNTAVLASKDAREALRQETARAEKLERDVGNLQAQLNELIEAKKADEAGLMEKFRDLLNEKKVKIREQQRVLATATQRQSAPEARGSGSPEVEGKGKGHVPGASRKGKRKTITPVEEDSDEGFEAMDVDKVKEEPITQQGLDSEDERTTDAGSDDEATASEGEVEEEEDEPAGPAARTRRKTTPARSTRERKEEPKPKQVEAPPPKRELPFSSKKGNARAAKAKSPPKRAAQESETDSDDEL